jgi:hypothetical protein
VTVDALDSISDTIDVADGTVAATSEALTALQATLSTLAISLDTGGAVVADTGRLTGTAAPALADATVTLRQMEVLGERIDGFLAAVANIPFTPDFDPEGGLGVTFGRLADDLDPLDRASGTPAGCIPVRPARGGVLQQQLRPAIAESPGLDDAAERRVVGIRGAGVLRHAAGDGHGRRR